ncbi:MAG: hypothetical protein ACPHRO_07765, partial [Nannocystaceae bacterium]
VFDFVAENVSGAEAPIPPFSVTRWRTTTTLLLILAGLASFFGPLLAADRTAAYEQAGRRGSAIMAGLSIISTLIVFGILRGNDASLNAAGISSDRLALEAAITGLLIAGACFMTGRMLRRDSNKVASAPSHGIYSASSSQTSGIRPMISGTFGGEDSGSVTEDSSPMVLPKSAPSTATSTSSSSLPEVKPSIPVAPQPEPTPRAGAAVANVVAKVDVSGASESNTASSRPKKPPVRPVTVRTSSETPRPSTPPPLGSVKKPPKSTS